ncbi:tetratricopeptide (TPR) repeat protein [Catenulispora sp. GAS73]|uniref:tetratricopeptide repeat protein n=1 Tax=Catenulispora sp. GAS73 TaxID=3156269 RepID=UPI003516CAD2
MDEDARTAPEFEFRLIGTVQAVHQGVGVELGGPLARAVLAVLLLHHGQAVPKTSIVERAWPDDPPDTAVDMVADYVSKLRRALTPALGKNVLHAVRPGGFRADIDPELVDVHRFDRLVRQAAAARDGHEPALAAQHLRQALRLWSPGVSALADMESSWLRTQTRVLHGKRLDALEMLAAIELDAGQPEQAAALLHDVVAAHPERERLTVTAVRALTAAGETVAAAQLAAAGIAALIHLGHDPSPALRIAQTMALNRSGPTRSGVASQRGPRYQLPMDTVLLGRDQQVADLLNLAAGEAGAPGTVVISAIDGMAGIGKTALAVHAGHLLTEQFSDGQLFVSLRAHTPDAPPRDPGDALGHILQALGLDPRNIPPELEERAKVYRDRLVGTRTLIVLDDAATEAQVRPLLPGTPGCLVLITSRNRLKGLDDAHPLSLDVLAPADAVALLRRHAGPGRIPADDPVAARIAELCGYLPLALRITAAIMAHRRTWTIGHLETRLRAGLADLSVFDDGDRQVAAAFNLSYNNLTIDQQTMFRRLGLIPGPDADAYAAAALLDTSLRKSDTSLQELTDRSLLTETTPGRYRLHDLLRLHAYTHTTNTDPTDLREAAYDRLLHYYAHTAETASAFMACAPELEPDGPGPAHAPGLTDPEIARAWLRTELPNLDAAFAHAHACRLDQHTTALAVGMAEILSTDGPWTRALEIHSAVETVTRSGPPVAHARALNNLGRVRYQTDDDPGAMDAHTQALQVFRQIGDRLGEANALNGLGLVRLQTGDRPGAAGDHTQALEIYAQIGHRFGEANALTNLGRVRLQAGDYLAAAGAHTQALEIFRQIGHHLGEANALNGLGRVRLQTGDYPEAAGAHTQALEIFRQIGHHLGEANALNGLGLVRLQTGDYLGAAAAHTQALEIHRQIGALTNLGLVRLQSGDSLGVAGVYTQALDILRQIGHRGNETFKLNNFAATVAALGDRDSAFTLYQQVLKAIRKLGKPDDQAISLEGIADYRLNAGDTVQGVVYLNQALEIYQQLGDRSNEAWALNAYAATVAALGDRTRALTLYHRALAMNRELNKPDDEAISLEGIADHHLAVDDIVQGVAYLNQALEIYRRLGMRPDIERVQARLSELDAQ